MDQPWTLWTLQQWTLLCKPLIISTKRLYGAFPSTSKLFVSLIMEYRMIKKIQCLRINDKVSEKSDKNEFIYEHNEPFHHIK